MPAAPVFGLTVSTMMLSLRAIFSSGRLSTPITRIVTRSVTADGCSCCPWAAGCRKISSGLLDDPLTDDEARTSWGRERGGSLGAPAAAVCPQARNR